jgi:hypothetical protein
LGCFLACRLSRLLHKIAGAYGWTENSPTGGKNQTADHGGSWAEGHAQHSSRRSLRGRAARVGAGGQTKDRSVSAGFYVSAKEGRIRKLEITNYDFKLGRATARRALCIHRTGVAMLSSVLNSKRAVQVNIEIMRTFARLRQLLASHASLARKLEALERRYDNQFKIVFDALRELMVPQPPKKRRIGFLVSERAAACGKLRR